MQASAGVWSDKTPHARGYGKAHYRRRAALLAREPLCRTCWAGGIAMAATDMDHIIPKAKGGGDGWENLEPLCRQCHKTKTADENRAKPRTRIGSDGWPV